MKYIITEHAKQRRPHHTPREESFLIGLMETFNILYSFELLDDGKYKLQSGKNAAIFAKVADKMTLITIRGFTDIQMFPEIPLKKITDGQEQKRRNRKAFSALRRYWTIPYPAIFIELSDGSYEVNFPGINCEAFGTTFENALRLAKEVLSNQLSLMISQGISRPIFDINEVKKLAEGNILCMIEPNGIRRV